MSREALINQGKLVYENIKNVDQATLLNDPKNLQPWNGLNFDDFVESYNDMLFLLDGIYSNDVLEKSPFNLLNGTTCKTNKSECIELLEWQKKEKLAQK